MYLSFKNTLFNSSIYSTNIKDFKEYHFQITILIMHTDVTYKNTFNCPFFSNVNAKGGGGVVFPMQ